MPRSRSAKNMLTNPMVSGPTKAPAAPKMSASTPRVGSISPIKAPTVSPPRGGLAPPMSKALARPKTPNVPLPSRANQGPNASGNKRTAQSLRAFGKQERKIRNAMNAQAGNTQTRAGIINQPMAGNAASSLPQQPDSASGAITQDATY